VWQVREGVPGEGYDYGVTLLQPPLFYAGKEKKDGKKLCGKEKSAIFASVTPITILNN